MIQKKIIFLTMCMFGIFASNNATSKAISTSFDINESIKTETQSLEAVSDINVAAGKMMIAPPSFPDRTNRLRNIINNLYQEVAKETALELSQKNNSANSVFGTSTLDYLQTNVPGFYTSLVEILSPEWSNFHIALFSIIGNSEKIKTVMKSILFDSYNNTFAFEDTTPYTPIPNESLKQMYFRLGSDFMTKLQNLYQMVEPDKQLPTDHWLALSWASFIKNNANFSLYNKIALNIYFSKLPKDEQVETIDSHLRNFGYNDMLLPAEIKDLP